MIMCHAKKALYLDTWKDIINKEKSQKIMKNRYSHNYNLRVGIKILTKEGGK